MMEKQPEKRPGLSMPKMKFGGVGIYTPPPSPPPPPESKAETEKEKDDGERS